MLQPLSGRFVVRQFDAGARALVGVVHLPAEFVPQEGPSYLVALGGEAAHIWPEPVSAGLPDELQGQGIDAALRGPCWHRTKATDTLTARFMAAFPESNGWVVYGAANQPLLKPGQYSKDGHAWCDILNGDWRPIASPAPGGEYGVTCAQLLNTLAVWPDAAGVPHVMDTNESGWREVYHAYSLLQARYGAGEIDQAELIAAVRADPRLMQIRSASIDEPYCRYLAALRDAGGIRVGAPRTQATFAADMALARAVLERLSAADTGTCRLVAAGGASTLRQA